MNTFIFQSVEDRFDLRKELEVGKQDTWYATRYRSEMRVGDVAYFWMGGPTSIRGLYGWGNLISEAYLKSGWDSHGVEVKYRCKFGAPILATTLMEARDLGDMLIFRAPQATNFLLSPEEAGALAAFVRDHGEKAPPLGGGP
jgi:EVE domain-containing protein